MPTSGSRLPTRIVLDTSAYSRFVARDERVTSFLEAAQVIYLPAVVVGELESGFRAGRRFDINRNLLMTFLDIADVRVLPVTTDVARVYGLLHAELKRLGTPLSTNDLWIAATTMETGAHLVTFDRDFEEVPALDRTVLKAS